MKDWWRIKKMPVMNSRFWIRALAGLFALALLFTMLSGVSASVTVAKVKAEKPVSKKISHTVKAQGQVEVRREAAEVTQGDLLVKSVSVRVGETVEAGEELFRVDAESLSEKMEEIDKEIKALELQNEALSQNESLEASQRQKALNRAREDYADVREKSQKSVDSAKQALSDAQEELSDTSASLAEAKEAAVSQQQTVEALETQLSDCTAAQKLAEEEAAKAGAAVEEQKVLLEELQKAAADDPEASDPQAVQEAKDTLLSLTEALSDRQEELQQAKEKAAEIKKEYDEAAGELEARQAALAELQQQVSQGQAAVQEKENSLSDARDAGEEEEKTAARAIEDASAGGSADASQDINTLSIEDWQKKLDKLQALQDANGIVSASQGGIVTKLYVEAGQKTTDTAAVMLGDGSSGYLFTVRIGKDDADYVAVGDLVTIKGVGKTLEDCPVISMGTDETGEQAIVTVELKSDLFAVGESATMEATRTSEQYSYTVPAEALIQENNKTYVMLVDTEDTVLGSQNVARRIEVELQDKNETYAAIDSEALSGEALVITEQDRYVEAGDRIRLTEE